MSPVPVNNHCNATVHLFSAGGDRTDAANKGALATRADPVGGMERADPVGGMESKTTGSLRSSNSG